jgi:hypothetical protein
VRLAAEGKETKASVVYQYLTGARFKQHMQAIVEAFTTMQEDLGAEKKVMMKQWAKRKMQIERVIESTAGLWGVAGDCGRETGRHRWSNTQSFECRTFEASVQCHRRLIGRLAFMWIVSRR